jgi:nitric oxide reductase activation protein
VPRRDEDGEPFDLDALVDWRIAVRLRGRSDGRVYRGPDRCKSFASVWLLIDQSASTASMHAPGGPSVLHVATRLAAAVALALQGMGVACAVGAFNSRGRYAVSLQAVKAFAAPVDSAVLGRLQALRSGGSTRLGAALRHAAGRLAERRGRPCWVLVLSDGDPHDIDVHDPRYLVEDARQAVRAAARIDVRTACLAVASDGGAAARLVFGRGAVQPVQGLRDLPGALRRLLG